MSVYGDTAQLQLVGGVIQPSNTLIDVMKEEAHWLVTLGPLRSKQGQRIVQPTGAVAFVFGGTVGHAGRQIPFEVDWPIQGGTFAVCCSSLRAHAALEGSFFATAGNATLDVVFTAWCARQAGPRQTVWTPRRTVYYGDMKAPADPSSIARLSVPGWACAYSVQVGSKDAGALVDGILEARTFNQSPAAAPVRSDEWSLNALAVGAGVRVGLLEQVIAGSNLAPARRAELAPDAESLELENTTARELRSVRVVYDLDLG